MIGKIPKDDSDLARHDGERLRACRWDFRLREWALSQKPLAGVRHPRPAGSISKSLECVIKKNATGKKTLVLQTTV